MVYCKDGKCHLFNKCAPIHLPHILALQAVDLLGVANNSCRFRSQSHCIPRNWAMPAVTPTMVLVATLLVLVLLSSLCDRSDATAFAELPNVDPFADCKSPNGPSQQKATVLCNDGTSYTTNVLGVARLECGKASGLSGGVCVGSVKYAYMVSVDMRFVAAGKQSCNTTIPWSVVPNVTATASSTGLAYNCYSAVVCTRSNPLECAEISQQNVTMSVGQPTFMRQLQDAQIEFPYVYMHLMRKKMAGASASYFPTKASINSMPISSQDKERVRVLQSQLALQNDDCDNNYERCLRSAAKFEQGLRARGCCLTETTDKNAMVKVSANSRPFACTQDFDKACCGNGKDGCKVDTYSSSTMEYCMRNPGSNNQQSFLSSSSSCWSLAPEAAPNNFAKNEYVAIAQGNADSSFSCCKHPLCSNPCGDSATCDGYYCEQAGLPKAPCNQPTATNRYVFPLWTPKDMFKRYVEGIAPDAAISATLETSSARIIPMSCEINPSTANALANNHTWMPNFSINGIVGPPDLEYYSQLMSGSDVPVERSNGVWRTISASTKVRSLICGRCGLFAPGGGNCAKNNGNDYIDGQGCCGGNQLKSWNDQTTQPTVWAEKNWLLGSSPSCRIYEPGASADVAILTEVNVSVTNSSATVAFNLGYRDVSDTLAETTNLVAVTMSSASGLAGQYQLCDPYSQDLPEKSSTINATGNLVICSPYEDAIKRRLLPFGASNPWSTTLCANGGCMPDYQTTSYANGNAPGVNSPTLVYYIRPLIEQQYAAKSDATLQRCFRNGFSDELFTLQDDCDQYQLYERPFHTGIQNTRDVSVTASKTFSPVDQSCFNSSTKQCACGSKGETIGAYESTFYNVGRAQSALCMWSKQRNSMCRPDFTSADAANYFTQMRFAAANPGSPSVNLTREFMQSRVLPTDWNNVRPNYWLGGDATQRGVAVDKRKLVLYYQSKSMRSVSDAPTTTTNCFSNVRISALLANTVVKLAQPLPTPVLFRTEFCPCQNPKAVVKGKLYVSYTPNWEFYSSNGVTYKVEVRLTGATCTVSSTPLVVKYVQPTAQNLKSGGTLVEFTCTIKDSGYNFKIAADLVMTPVLSPSSNLLATPTTYKLKSCDCTTKYASPVDKSCQLIDGTNKVEFKPNQLSTEPCEINAPPATASVSVTTSASPDPPVPIDVTTPPAPPPPLPTKVPSSTSSPSRTLTPTRTPTPNISPTAPPSDKDAQEAQGTDGDKQSVSLYIYIAVGVIGGSLAVATAIGLGWWIINSLIQKNAKKREQSRKVKTQ